MPFVKLDTGILDSTLWIERDVREVFITALLMAEPIELKNSAPQIEVASLDPTGFIVPPGWYGMVKAAGVGILNRAGVEKAAGMVALKALGNPEVESRSPGFEGRRLVRVDGGFIVLNFMKYRDKDHTAAERQQRLRDRKKSLRDVTASQGNATLPKRNITHSREQSTEAELKPVTPFQPTISDQARMATTKVMAEAPLSGMKLMMAIEQAARHEITSGVDPLMVAEVMLAAWRDYSAAKGKLEYVWGAEKFFGEGNWKDNTAWPWRNGSAPKPVKPIRTALDEIREQEARDGRA